MQMHKNNIPSSVVVFDGKKSCTHPNLNKHRGGFHVSQKKIYGPQQNIIATKIKSITSKSVELSPN